MYKVELGCHHCRMCWKINEAITWLGLCPNCGTILELEFTTIGMKPQHD